MNCLTEAIGLALPGNGSVLATHKNRKELFRKAAALIVENAWKYYRDGDERVLPRSIATRAAFLNAMALDIAMGGSTNTVLHLLAVAQEAGVDFTMADIDTLSRKVPCICKVAPNTAKYHVQDVNRAACPSSANWPLPASSTPPFTGWTDAPFRRRWTASPSSRSM